MGHNLGMEHDFYTSRSACKLDADGAFVWCDKCSNWDEHNKILDISFGNEGDCCTGFMDYGNHPEYWSNCSVRAFEKHYISQNWANCMPKGMRRFYKSLVLRKIFNTSKYPFHDTQYSYYR